MSEYKFKTGDRVVVVENDLGKDYLYYHKSGTILEDDDVPYVRFDDESIHAQCFNEFQLEFEHIYNSPVYKILSENE